MQVQVKPKTGLSKFLTLIAASLWLVSLFLPAFGVYSSTVEQLEIWMGFSVLLVGWLGPIALNFAWFSNAGFLAASAILLSSNTRINLWLMVSLLLSFDAIRFSELPSTVSQKEIYGLGWGAAVWILAMVTCIFAALIRLSEVPSKLSCGVAGNEESTRSRWLLFIAYLAVTGGLAAGLLTARFEDRADANSGESNRLHAMAFKFGETCKSEQPAPLRVLPGQYVFEVNEEAKFPAFDGALTLLEWGYSSVQVNGKEYVRVKSPDVSFTIGTEIRRKPNAGIHVQRYPNDNARGLRIVVTDYQAGDVVLDGVWMNSATPDRFCPRLDEIMPELDSSPRKEFSSLIGRERYSESSNIHPPRRNETNAFILPSSQPVSPVDAEKLMADERRLIGCRVNEKTEVSAGGVSLLFDRHVSALCTAGRVYFTDSGYLHRVRDGRTNGFNARLFSVDLSSGVVAWRANVALPVPIFSKDMVYISERKSGLTILTVGPSGHQRHDYSFAEVSDAK